MSIMAKAGGLREPVVVEVYRMEDEQEVKEMFKDINKSEPVKEVDLPDAITVEEAEMLQVRARGGGKRGRTDGEPSSPPLPSPLPPTITTPTCRAL